MVENLHNFNTIEAKTTDQMAPSHRSCPSLIWYLVK